MVGGCWPAAGGGFHESRWTSLEVFFFPPRALGVSMNARGVRAEKQTRAGASTLFYVCSSVLRHAHVLCYDSYTWGAGAAFSVTIDIVGYIALWREHTAWTKNIRAPERSHVWTHVVFKLRRQRQ